LSTGLSVTLPIVTPAILAIGAGHQWKATSCHWSYKKKNFISTMKHIGVLLNNTLSWTSHINSITSKANKMLGKCNSKVKPDAYTTLHKTEMVQR